MHAETRRRGRVPRPRPGRPVRPVRSRPPPRAAPMPVAGKEPPSGVRPAVPRSGGDLPVLDVAGSDLGDLTYGGTEFGVAVNHYIDGHADQVTVDVTFIAGEDNGGCVGDVHAGSGSNEDSDALLMRLQWQLALGSSGHPAGWRARRSAPPGARRRARFMSGGRRCGRPDSRRGSAGRPRLQPAIDLGIGERMADVVEVKAEAANDRRHLGQLRGRVLPSPCRQDVLTRRERAALARDV